eukprot:TRINITY_DN3678_c0_g1_i8.p1 TRINITY_DN3678_c0_g1~~TRINITY_DN3678_c0_g1_i8.p1  ORF type:complete len:389 (-),score=-15.85 TRINITY_DN3678_c0_g1_i8:71-1237(-)
MLKDVICTCTMATQTGNLARLGTSARNANCQCYVAAGKVVHKHTNYPQPETAVAVHVQSSSEPGTTSFPGTCFRGAFRLRQAVAAEARLPAKMMSSGLHLHEHVVAVVVWRPPAGRIAFCAHPTHSGGSLLCDAHAVGAFAAPVLALLSRERRRCVSMVDVDGAVRIVGILIVVNPVLLLLIGGSCLSRLTGTPYTSTDLSLHEYIVPLVVRRRPAARIAAIAHPALAARRLLGDAAAYSVLTAPVFAPLCRQDGSSLVRVDVVGTEGIMSILVVVNLVSKACRPTAVRVLAARKRLARVVVAAAVYLRKAWPAAPLSRLRTVVKRSRACLRDRVGFVDASGASRRGLRLSSRRFDSRLGTAWRGSLPPPGRQPCRQQRRGPGGETLR